MFFHASVQPCFTCRSENQYSCESSDPYFILGDKEGERTEHGSKREHRLGHYKPRGKGFQREKGCNAPT